MRHYLVRTITSKPKSEKGEYKHRYTDKYGKKVSARVIKQYTENLYIPPAYDKVKINKNKKDKVLAIGYDTKGRAQYVYNESFKTSQSEQKFKKMKQFGEAYPSIMRRVHKDMYTEGDSKEKQIALVLRLVTDCCFRIGNEKYEKDNHSHGITTLHREHIKVKGTRVEIDFIGKKGVRNKCTIKNKKLNRVLKTKKRCAGKKDKLFMYRRGKCFHDLKSSDVNAYLKHFGDFSVKDFRTWIANLELISQLTKQTIDVSLSKAQKTKCVNSALDKVAEKLHNTRSVCKNNYVDPYLVEIFTSETERFKRAFSTCKTKEDIAKKYIALLKTR